MEVRGYVPGAERTSINLLRFRAIDIVVLVFVVGMLAGLITLNVMKYAI
jgi:energy-coupling factor transporter transmembrane protein EcfT